MKYGIFTKPFSPLGPTQKRATQLPLFGVLAKPFNAPPRKTVIFKLVRDSNGRYSLRRVEGPTGQTRGDRQF
jgi:hypothetical protein